MGNFFGTCESSDSDQGYLAYALVVNLKVEGAYGHQRIEVREKAVAKSNPAFCYTPAGSRGAAPNLLSLDRPTHKQVLAFLEPNLVWHIGVLEWIHSRYRVHNEFKPRRPKSKEDLWALTALRMDECHLNGAIPDSLGNLQNLDTLELSFNKLTGSIPESLGQLKKLRRLLLNNNRLSGTIPESLGKLEKLQVLDLQVNQLSGAIPESLGNLVKLEQLHLHDNQLEGSIPASLGNLEKLTHLYLLENKLTGTIPGSLGNLGNLVDLELQRNQLSGTIPESLGNLGNLVGLYLGGNQLSDTRAATASLNKRLPPNCSIGTTPWDPQLQHRYPQLKL